MKQKSVQVAEIEVSYQPAISSKPVILSSLDAFVELIEFFPPETIALQEQFMVMYLNRGNQVIGVYPMSKGGITGTVADIRIILSVALKVVATGIMLAHNHPSNSLKPSQQDLELTKKIAGACSFLEIRLLDHLIITPDRNYYSFADDGQLK